MFTEQIQRKSHVPDEFRTDGRDKVAEYIETELIQEERLPITDTEVADEVSYSRQHVANVRQYYFEEREDDAVQSQNSKNKREGGSQKVIEVSENSDEDGSSEVDIRINISIPEDCDRDSYLKGFIDGFQEGL